MEPSLVFFFPDGAPQVVPLSGGNGRTEVSVGRAADSTVEIDHPAVSRHHLRLFRVRADGGGPAAANGWRAEDTRSANGTFRNGDLLGPGAVDLRDGDCLAFGPDPAAVRAVYVDPAGGDRGPNAREPGELPPPGATLAGRYVLEETLGWTPEFQNYRATDTEAGHAPASLKLFHPDALSADAFPALVARVDRLRAIPSHPGVIRCLEARREAGRVFVVVRWVMDGFPTLDLLRARGAVSPAEDLRLLVPAGGASDHVAAHGMAPLDLSLRPTLLAFHPPLADGAEGWQRLRHTPLDGWPAFTPRFAVALLAPLPATGERLASLARFACELLGRPLPDGGRVRPPRIVHPALGEAGNGVLHRTLTTAGEPAYADGRAFVTALAQASGLDEFGQN